MGAIATHSTSWGLPRGTSMTFALTVQPTSLCSFPCTPAPLHRFVPCPSVPMPKRETVCIFVSQTEGLAERLRRDTRYACAGLPHSPVGCMHTGPEEERITTSKKYRARWDEKHTFGVVTSTRFVNALVLPLTSSGPTRFN